MSSLLFGNGTDLVHWKPSPNTRGTFDILSTCLITMLLCVWTAVHLNISPPGAFWSPKLRKLGWLILALLAPEIVAYTAWYQRRQALSIMSAVNEAYVLPNPPSWHVTTIKYVKNAITRLNRVFVPQKQEPFRQQTLEAQRYPLPEDRHPWTLVHGFYALMGGIAFTIPENLPESKRFLPSNSSETWFVSHDGIRFLLQGENGSMIIPDLSKEDIQSKSKANGLAKALVCIQALWFIAQCLTRLTQHIPISLLELNTFGHAICALLVYLLWWEKPFEVDYPTMVNSEYLWHIRALDWMQHNQSSIVDCYGRDLRACLDGDQWYQTISKGFTRKILDNPKYHVGPVYEIDLAFPYRYFDRVQDNGNYKQGSKQGEGNDRNNSTGSTTLAPGQYLRGTGFKTWNLGELVVWLTNSSAESLDGYNDPHSALPNISLTSQDVKRWEMAWRTIQIYERDHTFLNLRLIFQRCKDWPEMGDILEELPIALGFGAAALIYGGLHALAWFAHFDSTTEQLLWRISACVVMGGVPVICVLNYLDGKVWINNHTDIVFKIKNVLSRALGILMGLAILAYVLARGYLVVECFINLSHLPAEVYDVPTWSTYFPHIS